MLFVPLDQSLIHQLSAYILSLQRYIAVVSSFSGIRTLQLYPWVSHEKCYIYYIAVTLHMFSHSLANSFTYKLLNKAL